MKTTPRQTLARALRATIVALALAATGAGAQVKTKTATVQGSTREALQAEFPGATITQRGGYFDLTGLGDSDLTRLQSLNGVRRMVAHGEVNAEKRLAMTAFCGFMTYYDGDMRTGLTGNRRGRIVCDDCGMYPGPVGKNCGDLKAKKEAAAKANLAAQEFLDMLQTLLQAYKDWAFWGGVGGMVGDMVSAASAVVTAGGATPAVNAAAKILIDMGKDAAVSAIQEAVAEALGIPNLTSEGAVQDAVDAAESERVKTAKAYDEANRAYADCINQDLPDMTAAEMKAAQDAIDAWEDCWRNRKCRVVY